MLFFAFADSCSCDIRSGCWFPGKVDNMEIRLPLSDRFKPIVRTLPTREQVLGEIFAKAGAQLPIILYEDVDHGSTVHRELRDMRRSFPGQLPIRRPFGVGCLCFGPVNLACFPKIVESMRLSGWLSPGFLKITLAVVLYLTWDGPDRIHPNCVSVATAVSFQFGVITVLASLCIFFGVAPGRHVWKGVNSERSEDKLNLFTFGVTPARRVMERGSASFLNDAVT